MSLRDDLEAFRQIQASLSERASRDLGVLWSRLDPADRHALAAALLEHLPDIVQTYGDVSAVAGADFYDSTRDAAGAPGSFQAVVADSTPRAQIEGSIRWALATPDVLGNLTKLTDRLTKRPGRQSLLESVQSDPAKPRFARVPSGSETCRFCATLASRGAVYLSAETADGHDYHDHCHCEAVAVFKDQPLPSGYNPEHYLALYRDSGGASIDLSDRTTRVSTPPASE